tara:strand:+ start:91 stop:651 length:561 start_codon:yes stop_codon:yes gene_type:complete
MRIDEVIQEAPFGVGDRMWQGAKNIGSRLASPFSGRAQNELVAGKVKQKAMTKANEINDDFVAWKAQTYPQSDAAVVRAAEVLKYLKDKHQINNLLKQGLNSIAPILKNSQRQLPDAEYQKVFLALAMRDFKDSDNDGTPDAKDTSPGTDTADGTLSPADSALKGALDKLDPQMQAKALQYLQSKK